jgi:hypothetical protein
MADDQDWRLRADIADAAGLLGRLREARHFDRELEPLIAPDVVLSADGDTLFAYANTRAGIDATATSLRHQLAQESREAKLVISHWDDAGEDWHQVDPAPDAAELARERREDAEQEAQLEADARIETRTVAFTSGKMARNWFETAAADEARELGVALSIVEHPHLLSTQIVFTLTGPSGKIDEVIADMHDRGGAATRLGSAYQAPI